MSRLLAVFAASACVFLTALPAQGRPVRGIAIDADIKTADITMIGTVTAVRVVQARTSGPFSSQVEIQELTVRAAVAFAGTKRGAVIKLRHPRVLPSSQMVINGFGPPLIKHGDSYVFFLKQSGAGYYELVAIEASLPRIDAPALKRLRKARLRGTPIERLVGAMTTAIDSCTDECGPAIWLVSGSKTMKKRLASSATRARFVRSLLRITSAKRTSYNSKIAAFTELGRMGIKRALPRIIAIATGAPGKGKTILSNSIGYLQGFDEPTQMKALETIIRRARDPGVVAQAKRRLKYLESRVRP